jgi:integrase
MRGSTYRQCWCRDPATGKPLRDRCPDLGKKGHGQWYYRHDAPRAPGEPRRQLVSKGFGTKKQAEEELAAALARVGGGGAAPDRSIRVAGWLDEYLAGKINLKARTLETDREAFRLYWIPALGHMRLVDVRKRHVDEVLREMLKINLPDAGPPSDMLRRMTAARADDERRHLPPGEQRRKKVIKPLSPARIVRMYAPFRAAMNAAVPSVIAVSPCAGVQLPRARKVRPLAWTQAREDAFRAALGRRIRAAGGDLAAAGRQALWAAADLRPCPVMVWLPAHTGRFLEAIESERLYALYCLAAFCGLRRDELLGLPWAEVDLEQPSVTVRDTGGGDGPKSERGTRTVPLPGRVAQALRAWRRAQAAERLAWGEAWDDTGRVFTREDGTAVPGQWVSVRFETLAWRAGLPPVRFHDLRHGAASILKAAGYDSKFIAAILGHARSSFTDDVYVTLFPEVAAEAMDAAAAIVPARTLHAHDGR